MATSEPAPRDSGTLRLAGRRVWVAGHRGMVGSAICRCLQQRGVAALTVESRACDLRDQAAVRTWVQAQRPEVVFVAAGRVGGIEANRTQPADFLYDNLMIAANVIAAAAAAGVRKLMYLGSSCFYPRLAEQPIREESLLQGPFEPTNEWYAVAKTAGVKLCQAYRRQGGHDFIAAVPTNLYGPGDHFDAARGHVIPALLRRFDEARREGRFRVELWGTGQPRREFVYVEDAAEALVQLMERYSSEEIINVAGGEEVTIAALAGMIADVTGYRGEIGFDTSKPDGMPRKVLDGSRLQGFGWRPRVNLAEGLRRTYDWWRQQAASELAGRVVAS